MSPRSISLSALGLVVLIAIGYLLWPVSTRPSPPLESASAPVQEAVGERPPSPSPEADPKESHDRRPTPFSRPPAPTEQAQGAKRESPAGQSASLKLRIFGSVRDDSGRPITEARIFWFSGGVEGFLLPTYHPAWGGSPQDFEKFAGSFERRLSTRGRSDGSFETVVETAGGLGHLAASATGYETRLGSVMQLSQQGKASADPGPTGRRRHLEIEIEFRLRTAGTVSGQVKDAATGEPVEGATIWAFELAELSQDSESMRPDGITDADGTYILQGLPSGGYWLTTGNGESGFAPSPRENIKRVILRAGSHERNVDFEVSRGGRLLIEVKDPDGEAAENAYCSISTNPDQALRHSVPWVRRVIQPFRKTDADGKCDFQGLPWGRYEMRVASQSAGAPPAPQNVVLSESDPFQRLEVIFVEPAFLAGRVVDTSGQPLADLPVEARILGDKRAVGSVQVVSDQNGRFQFENLFPGKYLLMSGSDQWRLAETSERFDLEAGERKVGLVVTLEEKEEEEFEGVAGIVVDERGAPVQHARVHVSRTHSRWGTSTSLDGRFRVMDRGNEAYAVLAYARGLSAEHIANIPSGTEDLEIVLRPAARVAGQVLLHGSEASAAGGTVRSIWLDHPDTRRHTTEDVYASSIDGDGRFMVPAPAGEVQIEAFVPGYAPVRSEVIVTHSGEVSRGVEIRLEPGASVRGRVEAADGTPIAGASIKVFFEGARNRHPFSYVSAYDRTTDQEGGFGIDGLPEGKIYLLVSHSRYMQAQRPLDLEAGEHFVPPIVLSKGATIRGRARNGTQAEAGLHIELRGPFQISTISDSRGEFLFEGLERGLYELVSNHPDKARIVKVRVRASETVEVDFDVSQGRRIFGRLSGDSSKGYHIMVRRADSGVEGIDPNDDKIVASDQASLVTQIWARPNADYEIDGSDPGDYLLEVYSEASGFTVPILRRSITLGQDDLKLDLVVPTD